MENIREIVRENCKCKFCGRPIEKYEKAFVFDMRAAGKYTPVHLHLKCVKTMHQMVLQNE